MELTETLARMWLQVDPNRGGSDPDEKMTGMSDSMNGQPYWKWFVPRAEASIEFLKERGYEIKKIAA